MRKRVVVILGLIGALGVYVLNSFWAARDEKNFYVKRGLVPGQNYHDFIKGIEKKYPPGTPRSIIRTEFKDFSLESGFYTWKMDGTVPAWDEGKSYDRYGYRLGIFGEFWVHADYDSLEHLTGFNYYLDHH